MPALEMIDIDNRIAEEDRYSTWLKDNGQPNAGHAFLYHATGDPIYGPVLATNMEYMRTHDIDPALSVAALQTLGHVAAEATQNIHQLWGQSLRQSTDFNQSLGAMQAMMAIGRIVELPHKYEMSIEQGRAMARQADKTLSAVALDPRVQGVLAEANYSSYFNNMTMADGEKLLATTAADIVESDGLDHMPHLMRSNYAIGLLTAALADHRDPNGRFTVWDQGSGSLGTLSRIVKEMSGLSAFSDLANVSIFGNEPNPDFYAYSKGLAPKLLEVIGKGHPEFGLTTTYDGDLLRDGAGTLALVQRDILSVLQNSELPSGKNDVLTVTANFVWHRLPSTTKAKIIGDISDRTENSIFLIADMLGNMSQVNRRYYNYGNNGILNAGNLNLNRLFHQFGYEIMILSSSDVESKALPPELKQRLEKEAPNDGHFWVAYRGQESERLVKAAV